MTDTESGFKVVDRRAQAESAAPSPGEEKAAVSDVEEVEEAAESTAAEQSEAMESDSAENGGSRGMPSPEMMLGFAAAQMEVFDLAEMLIQVFDMHAWQNMGLVANPMTGEIKMDLPAAQLAIDCVQFMLGKVESRLSDVARRDAQRRLSDLRLNYVGKLRESGK